MDTLTNMDGVILNKDETILIQDGLVLNEGTPIPTYADTSYTALDGPYKRQQPHQALRSAGYWNFMPTATQRLLHVLLYSIRSRSLLIYQNFMPTATQRLLHVIGAS
jgi:hypothetical protein